MPTRLSDAADKRSDSRRWVLMTYRLPREPSSPRITLWRKLRRLGVAQLLDGLVALPFDERNREALEWLAEEVLEAGGDANIWLAEASTRAQHTRWRDQLRDTIAGEYRSVSEDAEAARGCGEPDRRRALRRLRRQLSEIRTRDYFPPPERAQASEAVEALAAVEETVG